MLAGNEPNSSSAALPLPLFTALAQKPVCPDGWLDEGKPPPKKNKKKSTQSKLIEKDGSQGNENGNLVLLNEKKARLRRMRGKTHAKNNLCRIHK